jgi:pilus assembly protein CpaF
VSPTDPALLDRVRGQLAGAGPLSAGRVADAVRSTGALLGDEGLLTVVHEVLADLDGSGPLRAWLADPDVTDVLVNGPSEVWLDRGLGLERVRADLGDEEQVRAMAVRLAASVGRRLDDASPWVDARLPGGVRLHAVLPPLVHGGVHLSLRVPRRRALTLADLVSAGTVPPDWRPVLERLVSRRVAFLVTGGTGAGKTTVLATLLGLVPPTERLVLVEDTAELHLEHPHVVRLEARPPNVEGRGAVTLTDLVRQALRMRPDRLVLGEARGPEVRELLTALNTGHEGGCGTLHANDATDVPARLEALGALAGLDRDAVHAQAVGAVQVVLHLRRVAGQRRVVQVGTVVRDGGLRVLPALTADVADPSAPGCTGPGWPALAERIGVT